MDIFLEYDWLVKYNPEVSWDKGTIWFIRCPKEYKIQHQDIIFTSRTRRIKPMEEMDNGHQEISKKPDLTNPEDLLKYIQSFTYLFNKFEKLLE